MNEELEYGKEHDASQYKYGAHNQRNILGVLIAHPSSKVRIGVRRHSGPKKQCE